MSSTQKVKFTIPDLARKKASRERLVMVAVGEIMTARWVERVGVDILGVGVAFAADVRTGQFPDAEHAYKMPDDEAKKRAGQLKNRPD